MRSFRVEALRVRVLDRGQGAGTYFQSGGADHWLTGSLIANPLSGYAEYKATRRSWGIDALDSLVVEAVAEDGTVGVATGSGGVPAAWLLKHHLARFVVGEDARHLNRVWDLCWRATLPYGRKGLPLMAISALDLALWDLVGKLRGEPVVQMIGGRVRPEVRLYGTGPEAGAIQAMGFWGAKVPLPEGPHDGEAGLRRNRDWLAAQRDAVGPGFPLMVDCYMALDAPYAIRLAELCKPLDVHWWEEALPPDDVEGYRLIRQAHPTLRWTTGEHEYTLQGFVPLVAGRLLDVVQPDVMWVGGLTEALRVCALAAAHGVPVIPHGSGPYSYHLIASQPAPPLCEYVVASADGRSLRPVFGDLFLGEPLPADGRLAVGDAPGFGMTLNPSARLLDV